MTAHPPKAPPAAACRSVGCQAALDMPKSDMMVTMLWGYAITGIVGIVGTSLGAWLTGRSQTANLRLSIDNENLRVKFNEKRELYISFQKAFHDYFIVMTSSANIKEEPGRTIYNQDLAKYMQASDLISMTAPPCVNALVYELTRVTFDYAEVHKLNPKEPVPEKVDAVRNKLSVAMRKDLGVDD